MKPRFLPFYLRRNKMGLQMTVQNRMKQLFFSSRLSAGIAQLVEQLICNQQVVGSNPTAGLVKAQFVL
jgi:hypothetical protein